ncbi:hypothetical protein VNO78_05711 [Psophocarpus tetragonolobus]|uniref:Uncharacterized protein n=1 Tax=Psophocarpus tetragonolobus TaxID=3891 RepID=A0AAN9XRB9_PSOTE
MGITLVGIQEAEFTIGFLTKPFYVEVALFDSIEVIFFDLKESRIGRRISLSDVKKDWRKTPNNVDEPSSKSNGEKVSTRNKEASGKASFLDSFSSPEELNVDVEALSYT